jgi:hypothetical protein
LLQARDTAEWLIFDRLVKEHLVTFNEPCVVECHGSEAECATCRQEHPETYTDEVKAAAMRIWSKNPMPDYCASRAELLKREREQVRACDDDDEDNKPVWFTWAVGALPSSGVETYSHISGTFSHTFIIEKQVKACGFDAP